MKNKRIVILGLSMGVGATIILLLVFFTGLYIGSRKPNIFPFWERRHMQSNGFVPHDPGRGAVGVIDSIGNNTLVVKDRAGAFKTVLIDDKTTLRRNHTEIVFSDLKKDDQVIVVGESQQQESAIKAVVIRVITGFENDASKSGSLNWQTGNHNL